ncbi:MAG: CBS domain-containing protein [Mariprofundaceae bacterium]
MPQAKDIMNPDPPYCSPETSLHDIANRFAENDISGMLVVDEDRHLRGIVTESDLVDQHGKLHLPTAISIFDMVISLGEQRFERELARMQALTAGDLMVTNVKTVTQNADLAEVASLMGDVRVHHLPVLDNETVVGLISKHDLINALAKKLI